jgi:hypothetical protein
MHPQSAIGVVEFILNATKAALLYDLSGAVKSMSSAGVDLLNSRARMLHCMHTY